ncbi:MAG: alpha/beta hydrolase [Dehalococcoidia bacterium]|nr:alpha/beta hydrolase [Dehalococcoidia bacterium]
MPTVATPDGAIIHYEEYGSGFPVLLFAPGGLNSAIENWARYPYNPIADLADEFRLIALDQRGSGRSFGPLGVWDWAAFARDHVAVLDALGVAQCAALGGCIGSSYCFRLIHDAPSRVVAAVPMNPVGNTGDNFRPFFDMFEAAARRAEADGMAGVVAAAKANPVFAQNPDGGPWANRIAADPSFAAEIARLPVSTYTDMLRRTAAAMFGAPFVFSVTEEWMRACPRPLLVCAGNDTYHPAETSERIRALAPDCHYVAEWKHRPETGPTVRAFLRAHTATR